MPLNVISRLKYPAVIAHRGNTRGPKSSQENRLPAFNNAIASRAIIGIELDINQAGTGELVVHHKQKDQPDAPDQTYDELKSGNVLTLDAVLEFLAQTIKDRGRDRDFFIDFEIKYDPDLDYSEDYISRCMDRLTKDFSGLEYVVTSFSLELLGKVRKDNPDVELGLISDKALEASEIPDNVVDFLVPQFKRLPACLPLAFPLLVYDVDGVELIRYLNGESKLNSDRVKGVITDFASQGT